MASVEKMKLNAKNAVWKMELAESPFDFSQLEGEDGWMQEEV